MARKARQLISRGPRTWLVRSGPVVGNIRDSKTAPKSYFDYEGLLRFHICLCFGPDRSVCNHSAR
jgi:hypothetical protein